MNINFSKWGPATVLVILVVVVVVISGAVVCVVRPESLSFRDYLTLLVGAAGSAGLLGVGRGVHAAAMIAHGGGFDPVDLNDPALDDPDYGVTRSSGAVPRSEHVNLGDDGVS